MPHSRNIARTARTGSASARVSTVNSLALAGADFVHQFREGRIRQTTRTPSASTTPSFTPGNSILISMRLTRDALL